MNIINNNKVMKNMCYITDDEEWKDIPGYEGLYQASTHGRIRSLNYGGVPGKIQELKPYKNNNGYLIIKLCNNGIRKTYFVHRLVAITFLPNPYNYPEVNHIDENKQNNHYTNLEWCTREYNNNYGTHNERISIPILCINLGLIYPSISEAGRILRLNQSHINKCCKNKRNHVNGYQFRYLTEEELNIYKNSNQEIFKLYNPQPITYEELIKKQFNRNIPVYCMTNNTIYQSASEAGRILGLYPSHITACCRNKYTNTGGYQFRYLTEEELINYMRQLGNMNMCTIVK